MCRWGVLFEMVFAIAMLTRATYSLGGEKTEQQAMFSSHFVHGEGEKLSKTHFDLVAGKGRPVCDAYLAYLEAQEYGIAEGHSPRCNRSYLDAYAGITRPHRELLTEEEHQRMLGELMYAGFKDKTVTLQELQTHVMWKIQNGVDIDGDGRSDLVYVIASGRCSENARDPSNIYFVHPYIWEPIEGAINTRLQIILTASYNVSTNGLVTNGIWPHFHDDVIDFFNFAGRAYFDVSDTAGNFRGNAMNSTALQRVREIAVFYAGVDRREQVCKLLWPPSKSIATKWEK